MSAGRTAAVVLLGIMLTVTLSTGNVVFAAHATVLDPGFATTTIEEEGGYETLADAFREGSSPIEDGEGDSGSEGDTGSESSASSVEEFLAEEEIFQEAVSPEYLESQIEPNVYRVYAYLHGNEDQLNLTLDTGPLIENVSVAAAEAIENATTAELLDLGEGDPLGDLPVERSTIEQLDEGPEGYEQAKADVREVVYEQVLDEAVERAYQERSNDELLALVIPDYDPDDYSEAEKERLVTEREDEIRSALRTAIEDERGDELEAAVDDRLAELADEGVDVSTGQPTLDGPATDLASVTVEALTTDMDYRTYRAESDAAKADLAAAVGDYAESTLAEEMGSEMDLAEAMELQEEGLSGAVTTVTWLDRLAIVLPLLAIVLVGLVYYLTRSVGRTAGTVGWSMVWAGFPTFVGATLVGGQLSNVLGGADDPTGVASLTLAIFERTVGYLAAQSLALGVVGGVLVAGAIGVRYGLHERFLGGGVGTDDGAAAETTEGEAVETEGEDDPLADRGEDGSATASSDSGDQPDSTDSETPQQDDR